MPLPNLSFVPELLGLKTAAGHARSDTVEQEMHDIESGTSTGTPVPVRDLFPHPDKPALINSPWMGDPELGMLAREDLGVPSVRTSTTGRYRSPESQRSHGDNVPVYQAYHPYRAPDASTALGPRTTLSHVLARASSAKLRALAPLASGSPRSEDRQVGMQSVPLGSTPLALEEGQRRSAPPDEQHSTSPPPALPKPFIPNNHSNLDDCKDNFEPLPPFQRALSFDNDDDTVIHPSSINPRLSAPALPAIDSTPFPPTNLPAPPATESDVSLPTPPSPPRVPTPVQMNVDTGDVDSGPSLQPRINIMKPLTSYFTWAKHTSTPQHTTPGDDSASGTAPMDTTECQVTSTSGPPTITKAPEQLLAEKEAEIDMLREEMKKMQSTLLHLQSLMIPQHQGPVSAPVISVPGPPPAVLPVSTPKESAGTNDPLFLMDTSDDEAPGSNADVGPSQKGLGKRRACDDGNDVDSDFEVSPPEAPKISIPKIRTYSRPKGGATQWAPRSYKPASPVTPGPNLGHSTTRTPPKNTLASPPGSVEWTQHIVGHIIDGVCDRLNANAPVSTPKRKGRKTGDNIIDIARKPRSPRRKELTKEVRLRMNKLIGIDHDVDILTKDPPTPQTIETFLNDDDAPPPLIKPLQFYFEGGSKHLWNIELVERVYEYLKTKFPIADEEGPEMYSIICQRFETLRTIFLRPKPRGNETADAAKTREINRKERALDLQRPNSRRKTTWNDRSEIALENVEGDSYGDQLWEFLAYAVNKLGAQGMSSDESEDTGDGATEYYVKTREWRSPELIRYLAHIDGDKNAQPVIGRRSPGNSARKRIRLAKPQVSTRGAVAGLPINFYNRAWLETLRPSGRASLRPQPEYAFPPISV